MLHKIKYPSKILCNKAIFKTKRLHYGNGK
jgi:hypothetical protein